MKTWLHAAGLMVIVATISPALSAQWSTYPTAGVPKTPGGAPDLTAPAPRTADGKPDLSGNWVNGRGGGGRQGGAAGGPGAPAPAPAPTPGPGAAGGPGTPTPAAPADTPLAAPAGAPPAATFGNIGANFKEGLPFQPWAADLVKQRRADNSKDNPDAHCLPMGLMQFHTHPQPRKIIQTPGLIVIIYEANYGLRYIFTDGRPLPNNDPQPWWYGYSTGKWDGDTLVVETSGFRDEGWLDVRGSPLTDAAKLTERFRRPSFGNLEIEITIDDPKAYTRPFTVSVNQRIMLDNELMEFICLENQKFMWFLRGQF